MSDNDVLTAEIYVSYPYDGKILDYYQGYFESVYVILHPFYRSETLNLSVFNAENWPNDDMLRQHCEMILWQEVLDHTQLEDISQIDIGLRTLIGGLKKKFENKNYAEKLENLFSQTGILYPDATGFISPFLENPLLDAIKKLGYEFLLTVDEHGINQPKKMHINDLIANDLLDVCNYTEDHQLLFATHWDSHCTFLCASKKIIDQILSIHPFEGFFCTPNTEVYWGLHDI